MSGHGPSSNVSAITCRLRGPWATNGGAARHAPDELRGVERARAGLAGNTVVQPERIRLRRRARGRGQRAQHLPADRLVGVAERARAEACGQIVRAGAGDASRSPAGPGRGPRGSRAGRRARRACRPWPATTHTTPETLAALRPLDQQAQRAAAVAERRGGEAVVELDRPDEVLGVLGQRRRDGDAGWGARRFAASRVRRRPAERERRAAPSARRRRSRRAASSARARRRRRSAARGSRRRSCARPRRSPRPRTGACARRRSPRAGRGRCSATPRRPRRRA